MTKRLACPPAPGPLEDYAAQFDALFSSLAQRRGLRAYLQGLLLPRDRNKTLTALAGAEPVVGAQHAAVQGLQFFVSESTWDAEQVNQRRLELLLGDPATRPHGQGVLVIDDSGDRKDGHHTAHVARQYLGSLGKTDNGIVAVTSLWADERVYWPAHFTPYTPASRLPRGTRDPGFRTKPQLAAGLVDAARRAGIGFRAVVADCFYGDNEGFTQALGRAGVAFVLAVRPRKGVWAPADEVHTPREAAAELAWTSPQEPGDWTKVTRRFRDGHTETWWAADARLRAAGWGPDRPAAAQACLDRQGQRSLVPRRPVEGGASAGVQAQGRAGDGAAGGVAGLGPAMPHPRLPPARSGDHRASGRHPGRPHPRAVQRAGRVGQHQDPPADPGGVRLQVSPGADRPGHAQPRRPVPATTAAAPMTHGSVRRATFLYTLKAGPAGGLRPPSGPATTRRPPGRRA
jgi:hypothetical protein